MDELKYGYVDWFGTSGQSYGYIIGDDGSRCYVHYRHISDVNQENPSFKVLQPGQRVKYVVIEGYPLGKGTQASKVEVILDYQ